MAIDTGPFDDEHAHLLQALPALREVDLRSTRLTDRAVDALSQIKTLTMIHLNGTQITDEGRQRLGEGLPASNLNPNHVAATRAAAMWCWNTEEWLRRSTLATSHVAATYPPDRLRFGPFNSPPLDRINLQNAPLGDEAVAHQPKATLRSLELGGCRSLTDAGLRHLQDVNDLEVLSLNGTSITDAGLAHLADLRQLSTLDLRCPGMFGEGLRDLAGLKQLEHLLLGGTRVNDASLAALSGLDRLCHLELTSTEVTDAGLEHLKSLADLDILELRGTHVTEAGIARLQESLPHCTIVSDFPQPPVKAAP